jgi:hypothetical protein
MAQAPPAAPAPSSTAPAASQSAAATSAPSPSAPASASAAPSSTAKASDEPSPDLIKQARSEGYKPEKQRSGETKYCKKEASVTSNSRIEEKSCVTADELKMVIDARQDQRNLFRQQGACVGTACNGT